MQPTAAVRPEGLEPSFEFIWPHASRFLVADNTHVPAG